MALVKKILKPKLTLVEDFDELVEKEVICEGLFDYNKVDMKELNKLK